MGAVNFTDQDAAGRARAASGPLTRAVLAALPAPSIFNTQPWRWRVYDDQAELWADRSRQLATVDPDGRMLTLSCGIALHHAVTALAAAGHTAGVARLPDPDRPDLLARLWVTGRHRPEPADVRRYQAMLIRRTDRRPFPDLPVSAASMDALREAAEQAGAHLHVLHPEQVVALTVAAGRAAEAELADPEYRAELATWTHRPATAGDGIPPATAAPPARRPVPLREFTPDGPAPDTDGDRSARYALPFTDDAPDGDGDRSARYALLFADADTPTAWLTAGEALSAVMLAAVQADLSVSPMSDVVEVPASRHLLSGILAGVGHPLIALRIGVAEPTRGLPPVPRRPAESVIEIEGGERR